MPRSTSGLWNFWWFATEIIKYPWKYFFIGYFLIHVVFFDKFYLSIHWCPEFFPIFFTYSLRLFTLLSTKSTTNLTKLILNYFHLFFHLSTFEHFKNWNLNEHLNSLWYCLLYAPKLSFFLFFWELTWNPRLECWW